MRHTVRSGRFRVVDCRRDRQTPRLRSDGIADYWRVFRMTGFKTACGAALFAIWAATAGAHGTATVQTSQGTASWYGPGFHGRLTANGERFDQNEMTAAHRKLPFGTRVRVTNPTNGRSVVVRINDRGPFAGQRVIDLSRGAAERIGLLHRGVGTVKIEVLPRA